MSWLKAALITAGIFGGIIVFGLLTAVTHGVFAFVVLCAGIFAYVTLAVHDLGNDV